MSQKKNVSLSSNLSLDVFKSSIDKSLNEVNWIIKKLTFASAASSAIQPSSLSKVLVGPRCECDEAFAVRRIRADSLHQFCLR